MVECPGVNGLWRTIGSGVGIDPILLGVWTERRGRDAPLRPRNTTGAHTRCRVTIDERRRGSSSSVFLCASDRSCQIYDDRVSDAGTAFSVCQAALAGSDEGIEWSRTRTPRAHEGSSQQARPSSLRH